ncbi:DUF6519 domain-containing protein [Halomonas sp. EGI 63088]|uniref:DUF6519 domain-containing protein n=1 Tax=Halomonas flagellata TaxID=2920385 RepID=A0ABS9RQ09_9GAMM|nr:DUF6519 domain-containing protein [Halomonas flagellata]
MKADLSRDTYRRHHHYARVLMQQGRVLLDADWNEQVAILLEQTRSLAADLIGPHGGPGDGFLVTCPDDLLCDLEIGRGRYYVDGVACELMPEVRCPPETDPAPVRYTTQPDFPFLKGEDDPAELQPGMRYLVYLDVWERHLNYLQADHIRELALGGPDTATRAKVVCQVKAALLGKEDDEDGDLGCDALLDTLVGTELRQPRCLRARARVEVPSDDPCLVPPTARYRGAENQLYRVEIHTPGTAGGAKSQATFKWSRDNGSVVFGIRSLQGAQVKLDSLGPDRARGLKEDDWVEIVDDFSELRAMPRPLLQVDAVDRVTATVTLAVPEGFSIPVFDEAATTHPLLRRWDQPSDAIPVQESKWIELENGVQVWFEQGGDYKVGDYWQIPARTAVADVLWPQETGPDDMPWPKALPPSGIRHRIAPLRRIELDEDGRVTCGEDCRCVFAPLCALAGENVVNPPQPPPEETLVPLGTIEFERETATPSEASIAVLQANSARLREAIAANQLSRVDLRSIAPEEGEEGVGIAQRRGELVRKAYVEAGVSVQAIPPLKISAAASGEPRVESDMVLNTPEAGSQGDVGVAVRVPVNDVPGVGDVSAERLMAAGIHDSLALSRLDEEALVQVLSTPGGRAFPHNRAVEILREARKLSGKP